MFIAAGKEDKQQPYMLFLQGGPGFECGRYSEATGWVKKACEEYRVILLDQAVHHPLQVWVCMLSELIIDDKALGKL